MRMVFAAASLSALVSLAACGGGSSRPAASQAPGTSVRSTVRNVFTIPPGTEAGAVDEATQVLGRRVGHLTQSAGDALVTSYSVRRTGEGIALKTGEVLDADVLGALASPGHVSWRPVVPGTPVPPCAAPAGASDPAQPVVLPSPERVGGVTLCYQLGPALDARGSIRAARARQGLQGWMVDVTVTPETADAVAAAAATAPGHQVALVVDDRVVAAPAVAARPSIVRVSGELRRGQAEGLAAALASGPLPVALGAPSGPAPERPIAGVDHWVAPIGVNVCGHWLPNPPETGTDIHSHGDGYVHVHPFRQSTAGAHATLGAFFASGGWHASGTRLELWDHRVHRNGDRCGSELARVRWSVNGRVRSGDPSRYRPQNGDVIVVAFLPPGEPLGTPPSASAPAPER